jgi:hypothetical protein
MLKDFPKCAWEITRIRRHSLVGEPGGGGGGGRLKQQKTCVLAFFFFGLIKVVKMAFGIEGSLHGWNINYHVATKFRNDG